jgi:small subunit ribosomal protein S6
MIGGVHHRGDCACVVVFAFMATRTPAKTAPVERAASSFGAYDLVLMLDTGVDAGARATIVGDVKRSISGGGELLRHDEWGSRALAYPINHREQAEYHLIQFRPGSVQLLQSLDRSLNIADDVLRFRIVKLKPGMPDPPDMRVRQSAAQEAPTGDASAHPVATEPVATEPVATEPVAATPAAAEPEAAEAGAAEPVAEPKAIVEAPAADADAAAQPDPAAADSVGDPATDAAAPADAGPQPEAAASAVAESA